LAPTGTRSSSLLDRLERSATSCLLIVLAGGATAGSRDALLGTWRPDCLVGIPVSECLVRIGFPRRTGSRRFIHHDRSDAAVVLWMGIDIAVRAPHQASLTNEKGELLWSAHRFRTTAADLEKLWARLPSGHTPSDITIVMEPTRNAWVPLAAWFRRQGALVVLVSGERS